MSFINNNNALKNLRKMLGWGECSICKNLFPDEGLKDSRPYKEGRCCEWCGRSVVAKWLAIIVWLRKRDIYTSLNPKKK